jgi:hypothetical protein
MKKKLGYWRLAGWKTAVLFLAVVLNSAHLYGGEKKFGLKLGLDHPGASRLTAAGREMLIPGDFLRAGFSSDGSTVILTGESYRGLWVARRDGSGLRRISDEFLAGWRPVGVGSSRVIYRSGRLEADGLD